MNADEIVIHEVDRDGVRLVHLWADRFDADRADLLAMQDQIVTRIARTLQIRLSAIDAARRARVISDNPDAEALALRAEALFLTYGISQRRETSEYLLLCEDALQLDPRNVRALSILALSLAVTARLIGSDDLQADMLRADDLASRALGVDPDNSLAHHARAAVLLNQGHIDDAIVADERALDYRERLYEALRQAGMPEE